MIHVHSYCSGGNWKVGMLIIMTPMTLLHQPSIKFCTSSYCMPTYTTDLLPQTIERSHLAEWNLTWSLSKATKLPVMNLTDTILGIRIL